MKFIKCFTFLVFIAINLVAQQKTEFSKRPQPNPSIKNLKVGEKVPDIFIAKIIRNTKPNANISDFKGQLLILDFWDTFCGSCIEALPKLDSLQRKFGDKIKILPVTYQSEKLVSDFFQNNKFVRNVKLPCVVEDKVLGSYFQHKLISHEVWIYKGIVKAITGTDYVTSGNIQSVLDGQLINWPIKNDMVTFDSKKSLFSLNDANQYNSAAKFLRHSGITGSREGIDYRGGLTNEYDSVNHVYRTFFLNYSIVAAFRMITARIKRRDFVPHPDRLVLEVKDKSKYVYEPGKAFASDWYRENSICYELLSAKPVEESERNEYIYADLKHLLGVDAFWEKRLVKCLVIIKTHEISNIDSLNKTRQDGDLIKISNIPVFFLDQSGKYPPAIDETGLNMKISIKNFKSIGELQQQLRLYGCDIIEEERKIDVMIIREKNL